MITKQNLIRDLDYVVDLGNNDNEVYDNLMAILEILQEYNILSHDCYDEIQYALESYWEV